MRTSEASILPFVIISSIIHACLIFLVEHDTKKFASLRQEEARVVMIDIDDATIPNQQVQQSKKQVLTEPKATPKQRLNNPQTFERQESPIAQPQAPQRQTPVEKPLPTPTRPAINTSEPPQPQEAANTPNREPSSSENRQLDQTTAATVDRPPSTGDQQSQTATTTNLAAATEAKPRRVVQCLSCPKPRYPKRALRKGIEGEPRVLITINSNGRVEQVQLDRSSGNPDIDRAAVEAGRRSRFKAVAGGAIVPVSYSVVIRGSDLHQQAIQNKERQQYTLPTEQDEEDESMSKNAD